MSEYQLKELDCQIKRYIDLRIALKLETDRQSGQESKVDMANDEHFGDISTKVHWSVLKPKHTFLLSYVSVIQEAGALVHGSTLRLESKNGNLKTKAHQANNYN